MALPTITIDGRVAGEPELRYTAQGKAVTNLRVVASERRKNDRGEWEDGDRSPFVNVTLWDKPAEDVAEHVRKGDKVLVVGRLFERTYAKRDGSEGRSVEVKHATVALVPGGRPAERPSQPSQPAADPWGL